MIYLLAILWFASGFFGFVYLWMEEADEDFRFPSIEFFSALLAGIGAPLMWIILIIWHIEEARFPQITLFKARNK